MRVQGLLKSGVYFAVLKSHLARLTEATVKVPGRAKAISLPLLPPPSPPLALSSFEFVF